MIQLPATCPGGGEFVRIFVIGPNSSQFGALDRKGEKYALDGMYIVGNLRNRFDGNLKKAYCHLDLFQG